MSGQDIIESDDNRRLRRLVVVGCALGLLLSYGVLVPLKLANLLPRHMSWDGVFVVPLAMFGWLAGMGVTATLYPRHSAAWILGLTGVVFGVLVLLSAFGL
jgi:hypothetical protein